MLRSVVHAGEEDVLQCDLPSGLLEVVARSVEDFVQREVLRPWDELLAQRLVRCVQRNRQVQRQVFLGELADLGRARRRLRP